MQVNPDLMFLFHDGKFVAWNYRAHEQFELTLPYLLRLHAIGTRAEGESAEAAIDRDLAEADLIGASYPVGHWGWDVLSHVFHVGTNARLDSGAELPREDSSASYINYCRTMDPEAPAVVPAIAGETFALPAPNLDGLRRTSLWDALVRRKTTREFAAEPIDLGAASDILFATFGAVHGPDRSDVASFGIQSYGYRRTSPSGGSLQTAEPYLVNFTIAGLPTGIYHYHSLEHRLTRLPGSLAAADLGPLLAGQNLANDLGFAVFMVARFDKMWWKYPHSRAYRVALMDVGHLSQTFHLACTGYSLNTWLTAVFYDEEICARLGLDPTRQAPLIVVGAGKGEGKAIHPAMIEALKAR